MDDIISGALEALERILNYCEEIDLHLPEAERSGYRMLPDYEVVRKALTEREHGEWVHCDDGECSWRCSVCRKYVYGAYTEIYSGEYHFCPYCGARMDGDENG